MSKKQKPEVRKPAAPVQELPAFFTNTRLHILVIAALAFMLYANTLGHGFVQDDAIVITDNMFTKQGVEGLPGILNKDTFFGFFKVEGKENLVSGGRYRPLTLVLFALLYQIVGENSIVFHFFTVLLFALTCVVVYQTLRLMLAYRFGAAYASFTAFMATLLFTAHPIHTEVVANVKGCDEILTLLGSMGALWLLFKAVDTGKVGLALSSGVVFFLACLSKENAVTFTVVAPLALYVFRDLKPGEALMRSAPLWFGFFAFFILRGSILDWKFGAAPMELMNNPFLKIQGDKWVSFAPAEKLATIMYTLFRYVQLLFWPTPLTHDYYPRHIGILNFGNPAVLMSLVVYGGMAWYAVRGLMRRDVAAFGVAFFLLTLSIVSNLVFPIGTNMGERFAFMPSVGFSLVVAVWLANYWRKQGNWSMPVYIGLGATVVFSAMTVLRNPVWESNEKLFFADVKTSANSAKIRNACGGVLFEKANKETDEKVREGMFREALTHLNKAIEIYPNYKDALISRGGCHFFLKNFDGAIADYSAAIQLAPDDPRPKQYLAIAHRDAGKFYGEVQHNLPKAMRALNESWKLNSTDAETARLQGVAHGVQGQNAEAMMWFQKAVDLAPDNASYLFDLGTAKVLSGDVAGGEALRKKAMEMNPKLMEERKQ